MTSHTRPMGAVFRVFMVLLLAVALSAPVAGAQDTEKDVDLQPLRPADTSSPRDTLHSFLTNANKAGEAWRRGTLKAEGARAYWRAVETLDFSTTPDGDAVLVRTQRVLLLKELLDRLEVPPADEIPGDREVAEKAITQWTLPDTRITITRIAQGPRAGEFLFSAATVQQLDSLYRQAKHLPYKPGATGGHYEVYMRSYRSGALRERLMWNRLAPVDTSNPRSTLEGFLYSVNSAYTLIMDAEAALQASPPTMSMAEAHTIEITAGHYLRRATAALDLSQVPRALRQDIGIEAALQLKEILDRTMLPPVDAVPDLQMVAAARQGGEHPFRWRFPGTEIEIVEILEGEQQGQFLFSTNTVRRIGDFYEAIRDLPYRRVVPNTVILQYLSPGLSEGFYNFYISTVGYLIPHAHFLGRWLDNLPAWLTTLRGGQTVWQWIALILCGLVFALATYLVFRLTGRFAARLPTALEGWLRLLAPLIVVFIARLVVDFIDNELNITGTLQTAIRTGGQVIVLALMTWAVFHICTAVAETIIALPRMQEKSLDASLLRIGARIVGFLIGAWIVIRGIQDLGADVIPLLAGLGVGGLAVALAAQSTIANFIGSLILVANRPVRVGDFCRYGDAIGTVEEIGLHSTRIRSLERSIVTIPNATFAQMQLDNFTMRDQRLVNVTIQLRYETTPEQLRYVLAKMRELLLGHPMVTPEPARVRFVGFGAYSLDLQIFAYLKCQDHNIFLAIQEDIFLRLIDVVKEAGTGFAFPSQTAYLTRDQGLDNDRGREAEAQVAAWREQRLLPFPEFSYEQRLQIENLLDYPPHGSPDHTPHVDVS